MIVGAFTHTFMKFESHVYVIGNSGKNAREITGGNLANEEVDFVACGAYYVCVKTKQRNLYTAGKNDEGQLCHGAGNNLEWEDALVVQDAAIKNKVISVACGYYHTMIVVGKYQFQISNMYRKRRCLGRRLQPRGSASHKPNATSRSYNVWSRVYRSQSKRSTQYIANKR